MNTTGNPNNSSKIAMILSQLRKEKGRSQKEAAADLEISQALLSHYEKGIRECRLDFLIKCSKYYGVTTDYLLGVNESRTVIKTKSADTLDDKTIIREETELTENAQNTDGLLNVKCAVGCEPDDIKARLAELFEMVDKAYPTKTIENLHQDNLNIARRATKLSEKLGYSSNAEFFLAYGYQYKGGREQKADNTNVVTEINPEDYVFDNSNVLYSPGNEPKKKERKLGNTMKVEKEVQLPINPESFFEHVGFKYNKGYKRYEDDILKNRVSVLTEEGDEPFRLVYIPYRFDFINDVKKEQGFFEPNSRADVISYERASYKYNSKPELISINSDDGYNKLAKFVNAVLMICTEENIVKLLPLVPRKKNGTFKVNRVTPIIWNETAMGENCYVLIVRAVDDNVAEVKIERHDCDHSMMKKLTEVKFSLDNYNKELLGEQQ